MNNRPHVIVHNLASVDGRITLAPDCLLLYGDPRWAAAAGSSEDGYNGIKRKYRPQAILEGSGSFVTEESAAEPLPPVKGKTSQLYQDYLPVEVVQRAGQRGWFTVVDSGGRVRWFYKEFPGEDWVGWHLLVLVSQSTQPEYLAYLRRERIPYLVAGNGRVDLALALEKLTSLLQVTTLVSTAGGRLNGALLRAGLVDEVEIDFFPALIGGKGTPSLFDGVPLQPQDTPVGLTLLECVSLPDGHVRLHYRV